MGNTHYRDYFRAIFVLWQNIVIPWILDNDLNPLRAELNDHHFKDNKCISCNKALLLNPWGRVTHICVNKLTITGSDNGLSPGRGQTIIGTNDGKLLIGPLRTRFDVHLHFKESLYPTVLDSLYFHKNVTTNSYVKSAPMSGNQYNGDNLSSSPAPNTLWNVPMYNPNVQYIMRG